MSEAKKSCPKCGSPMEEYESLFLTMETPAVEVKEGLNPKSRMLPLTVSFPLGGMRPGEYDCEVTVLDPIGQKAAFWQAPVMVVP